MTELKRMVIWEDNRDDDIECLGGHFIDPKEIEDKVYLDSTAFLFPELSDTRGNREKLEAALNRLAALGLSPYDHDEIREFFESEGHGVEQASETETYRDVLVYCTATNSIGNLRDWDEHPVYTYWDGSSMKVLWFDEEYLTETEVQFCPDDVRSLDTWDGNNSNFRTKFNHGQLIPLAEVDGEKVEGKWLLVQHTDYQGSTPSAKIVGDEEARALKIEGELTG